MSCLMEYEIDPMNKGIHHIEIDWKSEELYGIKKKCDEKNTSQNHKFNLGFIS